MNIKYFIIFSVLCGALGQETTPADDDTTTTSTSTTTSTTTSTSTTTTPSTTTSTSTTTSSTTTEAPKTTAAPSTYAYYNVTEKNITCIMLDGDISFKVTYDIGQNKTNSTVIKVPKPSSEITVKGSCNESDGSQFIEVSWGDSVISASSIKMTFEQSKDEKTWSISGFSSVIYMDKYNFYNASDEGKLLDSEANVQMTPAEIPVNHSFKCYTDLSFQNLTTTMEDNPYEFPLVLMIDGIQVQAFNKIPSEDKFVDEIHCDADKIADIVPIAVGCALAVLVIIVLIAYIIGRRRRSASYQSV